jgi:hypothetical protein
MKQAGGKWDVKNLKIDTLRVYHPDDEGSMDP